MRVVALVLSVLAVVANASKPDPWLGFNAFAASGNGTWASVGGRASVAAMADLGANALAIVPTWFQWKLNSTAVEPLPHESFGRDDIAAAAKTFRDGGGKTVILKPHVDCKCGVWRAKIGTEFTAEWQWEQWFASYTKYMASMASIAAELDLDGLVIGTEMIGTSAREADWRAVVAACRKAFPSGKLLYASNWGAEGWQVQWWDAIDYIGVDAYFPLASKPDPPPSSLPGAWAPVLSNLSALSAKWGNKPIVFTEVGYRSTASAAMMPGVYRGASPPDLQAQADLYTALFSTPLEQSWLQGILLWSWHNDIFQGGACDDGYTPHRKPAEAIARTAFGKPRRLEPAAAARSDAAAGQATVTAYEDGALQAGWQSWSFSGAFTTADKTEPLPGHSASFKAADVEPFGAVSLRGVLPPAGEAGLNVTALLAANASLSFAVRAAAPNVTISAGLCFCDDCSACGSRPPTRTVNPYLPEPTRCYVPTSWASGAASATATVPIADLLPPRDPANPDAPVVPAGTFLRRINIGNGNMTANATFWIDNVVISA